jgi:shikimate dehydrogenase
MRKFGLIGYPLGHSFSKKYFTEKFLRENITDCSYENYPLTKIHQITDLVENVHELSGFNVTIPYKSEILRFLNSIDNEASEIGAVNVVKIHRNGVRNTLHGYNSDITGIRVSLQQYIDGNRQNAIILGTGGSSKAVAYVLRNWGMNVTIVSRNPLPGTISYNQLNEGLLADAHIIVNTTPLGMYPNIDGFPDVRFELLKRNQILFDLVYNPEETKFMKMGAERGCITIGGIKMLHAQAERAWEIWNDDNL